MNRRIFLGSVAASALIGFSSVRALAASPRVIVIGGGMAGATVAKYIRLWSNNAIAVTLIDTNSTYVSNIMSNLVVTGQVARSNLNFTYGNLTSKYGINFVPATVSSVTRSGSGWSVVANGNTYFADRVVLAPGISMDPIPLLKGSRSSTVVSASAPILHAWQAGPQTDALKAQLANFPAGGKFIFAIPAAPYRCPPGPYERACVIADYLTRNKPGSSIVVLDANSSIQAEPENFSYAFNTLYAGTLTYVPNATVTGVWYSGLNPTSGTGTSAGSVRYNLPSKTNQFIDGALINIIPKHRAATIVQKVTPASGTARLANISDKPFAQVDVHSFAAADTSAFPGIHIIGDSHQTGGSTGGSGLPMAGHVANQEAKICASAIVNSLIGGPALDEAYLTANSACYSPINSTSASWLSVVYQYNPGSKTNMAQKQFYPSIDGKISINPTDNKSLYAPTEASAITTGNFTKMGTWYNVLMGETFN